MTIEELYAERLVEKDSDIAAHLPTLRRYAEQCDVIVEFGVRTGNSTTAFLAAGRPVVHSYDKEPPAFVCPIQASARWRFHMADTRELSKVRYGDLLFLDTYHTAGQLAAELVPHHLGARRWIILHDHIRWGSIGEDGGLGIIGAIMPFLRDHPEWRIIEVSNESMGLLVLQRAGTPPLQKPHTFEDSIQMIRDIKEADRIDRERGVKLAIDET